MKMSKTKAVQQEIEVLPKGAQTTPYQQPQIAEGFENMEHGDMAKPRLAVCQAQSLQRQKDDPKYIKGLEEGQFFNTITGENYGDTVRVSPLMFFKYRLRFGDKAKKEEAGKLLCQSANAKVGTGDPGGNCLTCPMAQWKEDKPSCTLLYGYASLIVPKTGDIRFDNLVIVSMKSANMGLAKEWNALMRLRQNDHNQTLPMWQGIYELKSVIRKFDLGSAYMIVPKNSGKHESESTNAMICRSSYLMIQELYSEGRLQVDLEPEQNL
jgi:hypothetical protein